MVKLIMKDTMEKTFDDKGKELLKQRTKEFLQKNAERLRKAGEEEVIVADLLMAGGVLMELGATAIVASNPPYNEKINNLVTGSYAGGLVNIFGTLILQETEKGIDVISRKIPKGNGENLKMSTSMVWLADVYDKLAEKIK